MGLMFYGLQVIDFRATYDAADVNAYIHPPAHGRMGGAPRTVTPAHASFMDRSLSMLNIQGVTTTHPSWGVAFTLSIRQL